MHLTVERRLIVLLVLVLELKECISPSQVESGVECLGEDETVEASDLSSD